MRNTLLLSGLLLGIFFCGAGPIFGQQTVYVIDFDRQPLIRVVNSLEAQYQLLFSYEEVLLQDQVISIKYQGTDLDALLDAIFRQTSLAFERVDRRFILLYPAREAAPVTKTFCGRVRDSLTQAPLAYANVYLSGAGAGTVTQQDGHFCFTAVANAQDTLVVSYVGYREYRLTVGDYLATKPSSIHLAYFDFGKDFVIVTDYLSDGVQLGDAGFATELSPRRMRTLPGKVEPDVLGALQYLPGISSPDGALANLHIRGSTPDQNLILWEDIPIYHSAHYFGTITAFNPYTIDEVKVYRGGFGAEYGGRIAGVVDLRTSPFASEGNRIGAGTNFLTAFLDGQLKIPGRAGALSVSLRRSMTELWSSPIYQQLRFRNQQSLLRGNFAPDQLPAGLSVSDNFHFFDTQLKYACELTPKDELAVAFLHARNDYDNVLSDDRRALDHYDDLKVRNQGLSTTWTHNWTPLWSTQFTALSTNYDYRYQFVVDQRNPSLPDGAGQRHNDITEQHLKFGSHFQLPSQASLNLGYQLTNYELGYRITERDQAINLANQAGGSASLLHTLFVAYRTSARKKTGIHLGLRANHYNNTNRFYWEPRLQFWHQFSSNLRWQFAAGKYYQFLSQLSEFKGANIGISRPIWVLADQQAPVINATHWQTGLLYEEGSWLIDAQLYAKESRGLSALAIGFLPQPSQGFDLGRAKVRGFDLLLKKRWAGLTAWLSYSLSSVNYAFPTFFDPNFAAPFDQRHRFYWAGSYRRGRWEYSLSWQIGSGIPFSELNRFELLPPNPPGGQPTVRPIYDAFNAERLAPQHQLNAAVVYTLNGKNAKHWTGILGLSLLNVYDQTNTYEREYFVDNRPNMPRSILFEDSIQLGITPNFVLRLNWK